MPALRIEALDSDLAHDLGDPADSSTTPLIAGTQAALLAWLTGRSTGADLSIAGAEKVPAAPYWI
ncbi:hypothetical protein OOK13_01645 [Streptomyces sp. NBC_00378]|uniref:hypothetical protein n=1 Tax=Streptomyces sp. NBC_00378 TaxID=2975732 RepID=UPI0022594105|nr:MULTISPECIES: hypothetical protein [unclassified Streptomyces]MCX5107255.1 hypothetical protein [Streptomyces sp. NBC_00378]